MRKSHIKLIKGVLRWHYRIVAPNGAILSSSQRYFSKSNARRAAMKLAAALGMEVKS